MAFREIRVEVVPIGTNLYRASSSDLPTLYWADRRQDDLLADLPGVITELLEDEGNFQVFDGEKISDNSYLFRAVPIGVDLKCA